MKTFPTLRRAPAALSVDLEPFQRSSGGSQVRSEALKGALWRITLSYELLEEADACLLEAFFADVGSSSFLLPGTTYSTQTGGATVTGSGLTSNTVNATPSRQLATGEFIAVNGELKVLTKPQVGTGLTFSPVMRKEASGHVSVVTGPIPLQCEAEDFAISYQPGNIYSATASLLEVNPV